MWFEICSCRYRYKRAAWNIHQNCKLFLTFLVAMHFVTALMLLLFLLGDWVKIVGGTPRLLRMRDLHEDDVYARIG